MLAAGSKLGLENRHIGSAGNDLGRPQSRHVTLGSNHWRETEVGAIPRHVRMIPGNPRQMPPVGAPAGLHVEIAARCQNLRPLVPFGVDDGQAILNAVVVDISHKSAVGRNRR
jgi:hypothetical protein